MIADGGTLAGVAAPTRQLDIEFAPDPDGMTFLRRQRVGYPLHVCRTLRRTGDPAGMANLQLQSCSGGVFEYDRILMAIAARAGARCSVTTGAATIVHTMPRGDALQVMTLHAEAGSLLEYLPEPLILFPGARLATRLRVALDASAIVVLSDAFLAHDPADAGGVFDRLDASLEVDDDRGRPLVRDRFDLTGTEFARGYAGVNGPWRVMATLMVLGAAALEPGLLGAVRSALEGVGEAYAGATRLPNDAGLVARVLAPDGATLRRCLGAARTATRSWWTGRTWPA